RLFLPFQRLAPDRADGTDGLGLGLSIVAAVATAHGAALRAHPGPNGGLDVVVCFPMRGRQG
ncbi:MAG TPA: ATP-binding protein, partial [Terriglobales bacterium]|nr:ATP-binding protein [Terriglobales bacterium]